MALRCPACTFESPDGSLYCDFCKEPFAKKPKAAPVDPLKAIPVEKLLERPEDLLKADLPQTAAAPPWLRSAAWTFLAASAIGGAILLGASYWRYKQRQQEPPPPGTFSAPAPAAP